MKGSFGAAVSALLITATASTDVLASEAESTAKAILERAGAASLAMKTFYLEIQSTRSLGAKGQEFIATKMWCTRPDRTLIMRQIGSASVAVYVNGKSMNAYNAAPQNDYYRIELKQPLANALVAGQLLTPTAALLLFSDEPAKAILENMKDVTYTGQNVVNGTPCYELTYKSESSDSALYFDANGHLRRNVMMGRAGTPIAGVGIDSIYKFVVNQPIPDAIYDFKPPAGAKELAVPSQ